MIIGVNSEKFIIDDLEFLGKTSEGLLAIAIKDKEIIYKTIHTIDFNVSINRIFNKIKYNSMCQYFKFKCAAIINLSNLDYYLINTPKKDNMLNVTFSFPTKSIKLDVSTKEMKKFIKQYNSLKKEENEFII